jgi:hypothetical protein
MTEPLWVNDAELVAELVKRGATKRDAEVAVTALTRNPRLGFPQIDPLWKKRFWPAVEAWLRESYGYVGKASAQGRRVA